MSSPSGWRATVCRPRDLGAPEIDAWHDFQSADPHLQNPFLSPEFALAVDAVRPDTRVAVVESDRQLAGFLAYTDGRLGIGRPVAPGMCDVQAFVHRPDLCWSAENVLRPAGLTAWRFDHLLGSQAAAGNGSPGITIPAESFVIDLTGGWSGYTRWAKAERGRYLNWLERKNRRFFADHPDASFSFMAVDPGGLAELRRLKSDQCHRMGWVDLFDQSWICELVERLASTGTPALTGGLSALRVGDRLISADFSLRSSTVYAGWLIAYDQDWATSSPGAVRWRLALEAMAGDGVALVDLGKGIDDFKRRFATGTLPLAEGLWASGGAVARPFVQALRSSRAWRSDHGDVEERIRRFVRAQRRRRYAQRGLIVSERPETRRLAG